MSIEALLDLLLVRIPLRFFKKNVVSSIGASKRGGGRRARRALIYFKTDPLFSRRLRNAYVHTNNAEIIAIVGILNRLGFVVDLVDRDATLADIKPLMEYDYEVYVANAAGNSAPLHREIMDRINSRYRVFFGAGPEPEASNRLVEARHAEFDWRSGDRCARRRLVRGEDLERRFSGMDAIFYVGNKFSEETYAHHCLPTYRIYPSSSPMLQFDALALAQKQSNHFLYFGGNGLICKGLDLVLEAFDGLEGVTLDVFAPANELDFWQFYAPLLARNLHIRYHGFVRVGSKKFSAITASAAFQVFPGSAEGCATSVVTCMRRGVVPVTTWESGVDSGDFGIQVDSASVEGIRELVNKLKDMPKKEMQRRVIDTYLASMEYTPEGFARSFEAALLKTLQLKGHDEFR